MASESSGGDRALLTLSSGAIALSFVYLERFGVKLSSGWVLVTSWVAFVATIVIVLVSHVTSIKAFQRALSNYEAWLKGETGRQAGNPYTRATMRLNMTAITAFVAAIVLFLFFAVLNGGKTIG